MSRARLRCEALARVHALRAITTQKAAAEVQQAQGVVQIAREGRKAEAVQLDALLADWGAALAAPGFNPAGLAAWGAAVNRQAGRCAEQEVRVESAEAHLDAMRGAYGRAAAAETSANVLLRRARARIAWSREEQRLAERDDENARRGMTR